MDIAGFGNRFDRLMMDVRKAAEAVRTIESPEEKQRARLNIIRAAAALEQCFGGITTRLWDDPFEWTLPEYLSDHRTLMSYLDEVESSIRRGFRVLKKDEDLDSVIPAPVEMKTIAEVLEETIERSVSHLARLV